MAARGGARSFHRRPLPNMVPSIFVDSNRGTEPQNMVLRDCNNNLWLLKVEKFRDGWHFTDGWVKFVEDNMIKRGDVLYYESSSQGVLDFKVLGPSGCKDDGVEHLEIRTTKRHVVKAEVKVEDVDIDKKPPKRRGKEKVVNDGDRIERLEFRPTKRHDRKRKVKVEDGGAADYVDKKPPKRRGKEKAVDDGDRIERRKMRTTKWWDERAEVRTEDADVDEKPPKKRGKEKAVDGDRIERREMRTTKWWDERAEVKTEDVDDVDERPPRKRDKEKVVDAGTDASVRGKRRKKQDFYGTEVFKSGRVPIPKNPYFVVEVREKRANEMNMPADVIKSYKIKLPLEMMVVDPDGRTFHTYRKSWKDGRVNYCGGWRRLYQAHKAQTDDKLICEFIGDCSGERGDLYIRVTLIRAE